MIVLKHHSDTQKILIEGLFEVSGPKWGYRQGHSVLQSEYDEPRTTFRKTKGVYRRGEAKKNLEGKIYACCMLKEMESTH